MMVSKLSMKFTREFIDKAGLKNVEWFDASGKNMTTGIKNDYLRERKITACQENGHCMYIPIQLTHEENAYLAVPLKENPTFSVDSGEKFRKTLEHSLSYVELNRSFSNPDLENDFLIDLILRDKLKNKEQIIERARIIHFDLEIERQLIFIDIRNFKTQTRNTQNQDKIQESLARVYQLLQQSLATYNEYAIHLYDDKFMLLKEKAEKEEIHQLLTELRERSIQELNLNLLFIVSEPCSGTDDYFISFKKIHAFHQSYIKKKTTQYIFDIKDYEIELLLLGMSEETKALFMHSKTNILESVNKKHADFIETFKLFFKYNLNTKETADVLFLHSNTIYYRIKKLSDLLDMDLFKPNDALALYIALQLMNK